LASFIAIFVYVCEQNWFYTILYSNYWGFGYITLVGFIFSFLADIVMNDARITEFVMDFIVDSIADIRIF
jgi:hypothetical protein